MEAMPDKLSPTLLRLLSERGDVMRLKRGTVLVREGDEGESLFVLLSGELVVFTRDGRGREVIYNQLIPGEVLGEMFLDGGPRSASVRASTDVECLEVRSENIRPFIRTYPEFTEALVVKLIGRLRRATQLIRSLALDHVYDRTISQINAMAVVQEGVRFLPAKVTQQHIANRIGATREMVNHVFRDLVKSGHLVRDAQRGLVIPGDLPHD